MAVAAAATTTTTSSGAFLQRAIPAAATPINRFVDHERLSRAERLHRDERAEDRRREELDDTERTRSGSGRPPSSTGPAALMAIVPAPTRTHDEPGRAHLRSPIRHTTAAAMIGTPAGANGVSTSAIAAPSTAA